ncbi:MAG: hypothetical protein C4542_06070 [Dehalococcoidia bacterium]|nr:MAG: hypothetical protein C4542_06070 [Dehalococcoidia bacterium]
MMDKIEARVRCMELAQRLAASHALRDPHEVVAIARVLCEYVMDGDVTQIKSVTSPEPAAPEGGGNGVKRTTLHRPAGGRKDGTT